MKEQCSTSKNNKELSLLEEGLYQERQNSIRRVEYKPNCCTRCIPYLRLIFLLEVTLIFGWGCYMIFQSYLSQVTENETTSITLGVYPSMIESPAEVRKLGPNTEMSSILVKPEDIDKMPEIINNLLKLTKEQNEIVTGMAQNSIKIQNKAMELSDVNRFLVTSRNLEHEKFTKSVMPENFVSVDENVSTDKNEKSASFEQFVNFLQNMNEIKISNDLEKFENRNDFTEDANHLTLKNQENHPVNAPNKLESLESNIATISDPENLDDTINEDLTNTLQDLKQKFSDLIRTMVQDNHNENISLFEETDKRVNARLELDLAICPPYESRESSDVSIKDLAEGSSPSQPVLAQEILEQTKNESNDDIDEKNEDKQDVNDSNMAMSSMSEYQDYFDEYISEPNTEEQLSLESIAKINKAEESMENIKNLFFTKLFDSSLQTKKHNSNIKSLTPNADKWVKLPLTLADFEWEDISSLKSQDVSSEKHWDMTYEKMDIDDIIPGSRCDIIIEMGILKVKCPAIKFDEKWNFTSSGKPLINVSKFPIFEKLLDGYLLLECDVSGQLGVENISNKNSDKKVTTSWDNIPKVIDATELQESTTNAKILNDALLDLSDETSIPFDSREINDDYAFYNFLFYDSNEEKVTQVTTLSSSISKSNFRTIDSNKGLNPFFDITQQQEQLKFSKEQDYSVSDNIKISLKDFGYFHALEKKLISQFKNEMLTILMRYLPKNTYESNFRHDVCNVLRNIRNSESQHPWLKHLVLRIFGHIQNSDYSHMDDHHRKKQMVDDLTWQQDQVSNTLEEDNKDVNLLENLRKIFQKMEILALCIDRLHERYLLYNKLDDDHTWNEFPNETEESR